MRALILDVGVLAAGLAKSQRRRRINDAVRRVIGETAVLTGRRRRAVDSTILADAVAPQDTIAELVSAIRRCGRVVRERRS